MLRLRNAESGRVEEVPAAPGRGLALRVAAPPGDAGSSGGAAALPGLLAADLIRRVLTRHRVRVLASYATEPPVGLNLYPPDEVADRPFRPPAILITWRDEDAHGAPLVVRPAPGNSPTVDDPTVDDPTGDGPTAGEPAAGEPAASEPAAGGRAVDAAALRLALLGRHYAEVGAPTVADVAGAVEEVARWRGAVARWADSPSRPMCAEYVARFADACDADLDTASALAALRDLEADPEIPDGAKFETFVHADAVLALDIMSEVGRPR